MHLLLCISFTQLSLKHAVLLHIIGKIVNYWNNMRLFLLKLFYIIY